MDDCHKECQLAADEQHLYLYNALAELADRVEQHIDERRPLDRDDRLVSALAVARHKLHMVEP